MYSTAPLVTIDSREVNEAFVAQVVGHNGELMLSLDKRNVIGGGAPIDCL